MFFSVEVMTLVFGSIWPLFDSFSVLFVLMPFSDVCGTISMFVGTMTMSFIVQPLTFINVPVSMDQSSVAVSLVSLPLPIILGSVLPHLLAVAILHSIEEFARVYRSVTKRQRPVSLSLIAVYHILSDSVTNNRPSLINVIELQHHALAIVHLTHYLILKRVIIINGTYSVSWYIVLVVLKLDSTVLSRSIMEHFGLVFLVWVPRVHLLIFVKSFFNVFLSVLIFLLLI